MSAYPEASTSLTLQRLRSRGKVEFGPLGRAGRWSAEHVRAVVLAWIAVAALLGAFAPRAEKALSGAGWEVSGSESVQARTLIQQNFAGLSSQALTVVVHSQRQTLRDSGFRDVVARVERTLRSSPEVASVVPPRRGASVSADGHTAIVLAGAQGDPTAMVAAAEALKGRLKASGAAGVDVRLTGAPGMWADFNDANKKAMMRSEVLSWPITMAILVLAFGSLVAAGLPLMLTIVGLMAAAGALFIASQVADVSIWAMNFALMFALALGIDYALFIVYRFRASLRAKLAAPDAVAETMDTAGKAVLFSGLTVLVSLSAVLLVPSPAFRSMTLGIMLSVLFVLAAALTLLPAVLATLGRRVDKLALPWVRSSGISSARSASWAERLWRRPLPYGLLALALLLALSYPLLGLRTGMPSLKVVPAGDQSREGAALVQRAFGSGAPATLQIVAPSTEQRAVTAAARRDPGIASVSTAQPGRDGLALVQAVPKHDAASAEIGRTIERLRATLPAGALVGGGAVENHDLERALGRRRRS